MKVNWFDKNGWLVISGIVLVGLAALVVAQTGPAFFGHSSDEVALVYQTFTQDCTGQGGYNCTASCPPATSTPALTVYRAVGGSCLSQDGLRWESMGIVSTLNGWQCLDNSYSGAGQFVAEVQCVEVGQ